MKLKIVVILFLSLLLAIFISSCRENGAEETKTEGNPVKKETVRTVPVEVMIAKAMNIEQELPFSGVLQPINSVDIVAELSGKITKVNKELGSVVTTRDVLAVIDDEVPFSQFQQAESQVLSAENNLKIAELNLDSDTELIKNGDISRLQYENSVLAVKTAEANRLSAEANFSLMKKNYNNTRIQSPIDGYISRKFIEKGTMVNPNMVVYRVVDLTVMKVRIGIPQAIIRYVENGSRVNIDISSLNKTFEGYVKYLSPQADENSGLFTAEIHVKNTPDHFIKAGLTARINLVFSDDSEKLTIPDYALVFKNGGNYVYKVQNNVAVLNKITIGEKIGTRVIVNSGIAAGDSLVVVGMKNLGEKTPVFIETVN